MPLRCEGTTRHSRIAAPTVTRFETGSSTGAATTGADFTGFALIGAATATTAADFFGAATAAIGAAIALMAEVLVFFFVIGLGFLCGLSHLLLFYLPRCRVDCQ